MTHFRPLSRTDAVIIGVGILAALVCFGALVFPVALQGLLLSLLWFSGSVLVGVNFYFVGKLLFSKR